MPDLPAFALGIDRLPMIIGPILAKSMDVVALLQRCLKLDNFNYLSQLGESLAKITLLYKHLMQKLFILLHSGLTSLTKKDVLTRLLFP